jgi:hypothetical protein
MSEQEYQEYMAYLDTLADNQAIHDKYDQECKEYLCGIDNNWSPN